MLDPHSGFLIEVEPLEVEHSAHGILNPFTGVLKMPMKYPCIDLVNTSDEEGSIKEDCSTIDYYRFHKNVTFKGVTKAKKRVWRETDKQEWLKIYRKYMEERLKRQPQPLDFQGYLGKDIVIRRSGFKNAGKRGRKLNQGSPEDDRTRNLDSDSLKRLKTVKDLKRFSEHQKIKRYLGISELYSTKDLVRCLAERTGENLDTGNVERTSGEDHLQDLQIEETKEGIVRNCDRTEKILEDLLDHDVVNTNKGEEAIYLELIDSDKEETDSNHKNDGNANIEEYKDIEYLNKDLKSGRKNRTVKKVKFQNLRHNSLKLLKYSNICIFKWTKHYFVCYECLQWFKDMRTLRSHLEGSHTFDQIKRKMVKQKHTFHKVDVTDLKCKMCTVILNSLSELENHLIEHNVRLKPGGSSLIPYKLCCNAFICQLCGNEFPTRYRLQKHMDGHFVNYVCPECNMGFPNSQTLKDHCHARTESGDETSGATFKYLKCRSKFKGHRKISEEARFKCSQCPQKFKSDYKRLQHLIEEHNNESKLFQCEFCPKIFMTVHWLMKHMNCVHQEQLYC